MCQPLQRGLACRQRQEGKRSPWLPPGHSQSPHQSFQESRSFLPAGHCSVHSPSKPYLIVQQPLLPEASGLLGTDPSCWVAATPVQSLPDFQSFFPDFLSPQFPCTAQSKHRLCCQLVSNRQEKGKAESNNCSMLLCWINNTLKKTVTFFLGNIPVN